MQKKSITLRVFQQMVSGPQPYRDCRLIRPWPGQPEDDHLDPKASQQSGHERVSRRKRRDLA